MLFVYAVLTSKCGVEGSVKSMHEHKALFNLFILFIEVK